MINIAKLLKDAPKGIKLYSPLFGEVEFLYVNSCDNTILVATDRHTNYCFTANGIFHMYKCHPNAECLLFPAKGQSWEGWKVNACKFKVFDWIIRNDGSSDIPIQIYGLKKDRYLVTNMLGSKGELMITGQDEWHLWTINDAKPGDILNANGAVFIYKKHNKDYVYHYCGINLGYEFVIGTDDSIWNANNKICPATQEQKDLLFNKIKEADYTWDLYSKTLTKNPKFKIGDWITDGTCKVKITDINNTYYWFSKSCILGEIESIDKNWHLWTIQDAKDGDVLVTEDYIFIFKYILHGGVHFYCHYNIDDEEFDQDIQDAIIGNIHDKGAHFQPATKEQCDMFFKKMNEAGYQWDADKKTLELLVQSKFNVDDWVVKKNGTAFYGGNYAEQVTLIEGDEYLKCIWLSSTSWVRDNDIRLWTIQDANDGDVITNGKLIVIFNKLEEPTYKQHIIAYVGLDLCGRLQITEDTWQLGVDKAMPATKEQRRRLFTELKKAGYEWDADKKELKKIPPHYDISNFHAGMPVLVRETSLNAWQYVLFSHCYTGGDGLTRFNAGLVGFTQCIPYNNDTKHLLGTIDTPDKMYINW